MGKRELTDVLPERDDDDGVRNASGVGKGDVLKDEVEEAGAATARQRASGLVSMMGMWLMKERDDFFFFFTMQYSFRVTASVMSTPSSSTCPSVDAECNGLVTGTMRTISMERGCDDVGPSAALHTARCVS